MVAAFTGYQVKWDCSRQIVTIPKKAIKGKTIIGGVTAVILLTDPAKEGIGATVLVLKKGKAR
jgi:hypothetical protein